MSAIPVRTPPASPTPEAIEALLRLPLLDLVGRANAVHRAHHDPNEIHTASLISIKTGGCPEDCAYCPQSAHHHDVELTREALMNPDSVIAAAKRAKAAGAERFCMGAAWRSAPEGAPFEAVLTMVREVSALGLETCVTLGMLSESQARRLADAGLTAYNHNLDTGPEFYSKIITTRTFQDRLDTLAAARAAGISLCCGGIIGMGETLRDRAGLLWSLASLDPPPESVPINMLVPVPGTPLADRPPLPSTEVVRMIAATRLVLPRARVRLSAGRRQLSQEAQILCFIAGANALFLGDTLLTTPNAGPDEDKVLLDLLAPVENVAA
ncbi:biotin synthase BioB [Pararhodospirillum oryzae]|uniref:Biotin synthase n=1 Tax=Pararhodospirillum oryzae TaxID=478448 RepID=A0A512HBN8_9PROT|nr:biotin synthase BioB [Pararhodospirillum oryzae]GEO82861.1 biotin synthase [Pararhodospirillum oryzae]